jgi:hypothetical protein
VTRTTTSSPPPTARSRSGSCDERRAGGRGAKEDLLNASSLIAAFAPDDRAAVETAYLAVLTRRPTPKESDHFAARLAGTTGDERRRVVADLYWVLFNSAELSWNH